MGEHDYMEARFILEKGNGAKWSDEEIDGFLDEFLDFIEDKSIFAGGSFGPMIPEEKECAYCEGSGVKDHVNEEDRCETCGGSGRKDEEEPTSSPEATAEWNDLYAPVAQGTEQPSPKGQVEGSNPSRSANVRNRERDREGSGNSGGEDSPGDNEGDREGGEDPGGHHSSEDG